MPIPEQWLKYAPKPRPLKDAEDWNVFLSYRSVNRTWVLNLYDVLKDLGYKVFIDQCELAVGDELITRLSDALKKSQAGILIWSKAAAESKWVSKEYQRLETKATNNEEFRFVPIRLDDTALPEFADNRIFVDFSSYPDGPNGGELLRLIHGIVGMPLHPEAAKFANQQDKLAQDMFLEIETAITNKDDEEIIRLFEENGLPWKTSAALGCKAAESLIRLGKKEEPFQILEKLEEQFPDAIRPKQLHALALARKGDNESLKKAQRILGKLYNKGERDPETLGIYARTWMDRYNTSGDKSDLKKSRDLYEEAFNKAPDDSYTGINAAAKSVFLGESDKAAGIASEVEKLVTADKEKEDYWKKATIAEVMLIQQKYQESGNLYQKAVDFAPTEIGSHGSTWKQAKLLMEKLNPSEADRLVVSDVFKHLQ
jgi:tetratricopeptide (TPR) repeat protein